MFAEHDQSEGFQGGDQTEQAQFDANDAARRRVLEYDESLLDCEHAGNLAEEAAVDRSARIIDQWEQMKDPVARRSLLEGVGRQMMDVHEAPPAPIYPQEMEHNKLGAYSDEDFRTDMNEWQLKQDDPRDALETYLHEYRHVEQNYEVQKSHGALSHAVNPERALATGYNLEHYEGGHQDFDAYAKQLVETDAERFGTSTSDAILERRDELRRDDKVDTQFGSDADHVASERLRANRRTQS